MYNSFLLQVLHIFMILQPRSRFYVFTIVSVISDFGLNNWYPSCYVTTIGIRDVMSQ